MPSDKTLSAIGISCAKAFISIIAISVLRVGITSGSSGACNRLNCLNKMRVKITRVAILVISKNATITAMLFSTASPILRLLVACLVYLNCKMILAYHFI